MLKWFAIDKFTILVTLIIIGCFALVANSFLDPDFPWHIRNGLEILNGHFSLKDQYSYTMPSFAFVNHSWLTSTIWAFIYYKLHLGYIGVVIFCAAFATAAAVMAGGGVLWLTPLVAATYLDGADVRTNVVTFLFLALLILIIKKSEKLNKYLYLVPLLLLFWANMHGGFVLGFIYIWGYFLVDVLLIHRSERALKQKFSIFLIFLVATGLTFATPYREGVWQEALRTINNPLLKKYVSEWQPMYRLTSFSLIPLVVLFLGSLWNNKHRGWLELFSVLLFVDSFLSIRQAPLFAICAGFVVSDGYRNFLIINQKKIDKKRLLSILQIGIVVAVSLFVLESAINVRNRLVVARDAYPIQATEFLKKSPPSGNVFSIVHWNSYLLWQIPDIKSFADGRMMVWNQNKKPNELSNAFLEYIGITLLQKPFEPVADQFCIGTILWNKPNKDSVWMTRASWKDITKGLDKQEWKVAYEDKTSIIYERPLPKTCADKNFQELYN